MEDAPLSQSLVASVVSFPVRCLALKQAMAKLGAEAK